MAARQARVLRWCLAPVPVDGPVVLVTNNFSTGGAQTSAARLLTAWRARGVDARAWVIQEQGAWPTPGTERLRTAGVPVAVASPEAGCAPAAATVDAVLAGLRETGARAVLFWNVIPEHKVRLAEALSGEIPVFDVSPGEMFFASLHRLFARPPADLPVSSPRAYGGLLTGVAVKFAAEAERARAVLGVEPAVIPNGLLVAALPPARLRPAPTPDAPVIFGTLARLAPDKRLDVLITAAARAATCARAGPALRGPDGRRGRSPTRPTMPTRSGRSRSDSARRCDSSVSSRLRCFSRPSTRSSWWPSPRDARTRAWKRWPRGCPSSRRRSAA
jgi:hypothetical protein